MIAGLDVYADALTARRPVLRACWANGMSHELAVERWLGPPTASDRSALARAVGPVLDVGCGPGRHLEALRERGLAALGVDLSATAVRVARRRGGVAVARSVFDPLPAEGAWATALLLDGNVGIGGDPVTLLRRLDARLGPPGRIVMELGAPGTPTGAGVVCLEGSLRRSASFRWARVSVDDVLVLAAAGGFGVGDVWSSGGRWFACLARQDHG